jgi:hypothetical protein
MVAVLAIAFGLTAARAQTQTVVAVTGGGPFAPAFDTAGNLYVSAYNTGFIYKASPISGTITAASPVSTFASGFGYTAGLAFDSSGNLYAADYGYNLIRKISPGGVVTSFASVTTPVGLVFDTAGNLYVTSQTANTISKITPAGVVSTFVSAAAGLSSPYALAIDSAGNLYDTNQTANTVSKITPAGVVSTYIPSSAGLSTPLGLAFDAAGNLYVANISGTVVRVNVSGGVYSSLTTVGSPGNSPRFLAFDSLGNLFVGTTTGSGTAKIVLLPVVTSLGTTAGPLTGGTSVTITGIAFTGATAVTFGGTNATSFTVNSQNSITAVAPAGAAGTVDVKVTTVGGTSAVTTADQFTYYTIPTVTGVSPVAGLPAGGTSVTITGTGFSGATSVKFGTVAATSYTVNSSTSITATAPAGTAGTTVDVRVGNPGATSATGPADNYTYENTPTVTAVSPTGGGLSAGTAVTITGTGLIGASAVKFGASNAVSYVVNSSTSITAIAPAAPGGAAGSVDVTVATPVGTSGTSAADTYTYYAVPTVTGISPIAGAVAGGGTVTITGTNFTGATAVKFGTLTGTVTANTGTSITVTVPAGVLGTYDVTVTTPGGTSAMTSSDKFTYEAVPTVTGLSPSSGPLTAGTAVTITGTNFTGASAVNFGGTAVTTYIVNSSTSISAAAPAGTAGPVDVTVTTPVGVSTLSQPADQYTYYAVPTVTSISPLAGPVGGGTTVTITGTGFAGLTGAAAVKFGATNATSYTVNSTTSITATAPAGALGAVDITVTTPGGTSATSSNDQFTYEGNPTVTAVSPTSGPLTAGTSVTITGTNFLGVSAVKFGGTNAISFVYNNPTTITATAPAGTAGTVDITVTTPVNTSATSGNDQFTYYAAPTVTAVSPIAGATGGGATITITGTGFTGATAVKFGSTAATGVTVVSATSITATLPAGTAGAVDVTVISPGGTSATSTADQFTYEGNPTVASLSPSSGPLAAGTVVVITGTNFTGATVVNFGANTASAYTVLSATTISATAPARVAGTVDVRVTTPVAQSAVNQPGDQYTYTASPAVSSVTPAAGPPAGGTSVTITGTGFTGVTGAAAVKFGTTNATSYTFNSDTSITATAPAGTTGTTVDVTVTNPGGTSATSTADQFTYETAPTVTAVSPTSGPLAAGTVVTITGTNFTGASTVKFGTTNAVTFAVTSSTTITATAPAGTAGAVDVTVTTPIATSATSANDLYSYTAAPTVTGVSPAGGAIGGGATITITGTGFTGATGVKFGSTAATGVAVVNSTTITATNPAGSLGLVNVTVTTAGGTSAINTADQFIYEAGPTITSLSPSAGPLAAGTAVTITGTNFTAATAVTFGTAGAASAFTVVSPTTINATAPAGTVGTVLVTVTTPVGTSTGGGNSYAYSALPVVTSLTPSVGPLAGTNTITITGSGFTGVTGAAAVKFGTTNATNYTLNSDTSITATVPAGTAGTVDVIVTATGGTSATNPGDQYTYEGSPTVTAVNPSSGPLSAGTAVTITGTNFTGATAVTFGAAGAASSFVVTSATSISAIAPAGTASTVDVTVTTPVATSGANAPSDQFTFAPVPTVTGLSVTAGPLVGGGTFTLTGTGFTAGSTVKFGNVTATVTYVNSTTLTVTIPAGTAGTIDVTVTTTGGTSGTNTGDQFTYEGNPTLTGVNPASGPISGGATVIITGTGFTSASGVSFGGTAATTFLVTSSTSISATVPAALAAGAVDVTVTTPVNTSAANPATDQFTYYAVPAVNSVSPSSALAGTVVTVTGTGFTGATAVKFGSFNATAFTVVNATTITATAPVGASGTVDITLTNPAGTSAAVLADNFTYLVPSVGSTPVVTGPLPVITSPLNYASAVNQPFSYTIFANNTPTSYNATGLPPGLYINTYTGGITGTPTIAGTYTLTISASNAFGTASATLLVTITSPGQAVSASGGMITSPLTYSSLLNQPFSYTIFASNNPTSYNAVAVSPSVFPAGLYINTYTGGITGTPTVAGTYTLLISASSASGTVTANLVVTIVPPGTTTTTLPVIPLLVNLSARSMVTPASPLSAGFIIAGPASKTVVLRGIGPGMSAFGLSPVLAHPQLTLMDVNGNALATNTGWGGSTTLANAFAQVGAFPLSSTSADSALVATLPPGIYTMRVSDAVNDAGGLALAELYDATIDPAALTKTINLSSRGQVMAGNGVLVCGFIVSGTSPKPVLIRGVGPTLANYGLTNLVADPVLNVYNSAGTLVATNNDWGTPVAVNATQVPATAAALASTATQVGAFPLTSGSKDAAVIISLAPGAYTAQVSGNGGATGLGLVEVYAMPQ